MDRREIKLPFSQNFQSQNICRPRQTLIMNFYLVRYCTPTYQPISIARQWFITEVYFYIISSLHVLHQLLPPGKNVLHFLRPRAHDREVPVANATMRKNISFTACWIWTRINFMIVLDIIIIIIIIIIIKYLHAFQNGPESMASSTNNSYY